MESTFKSTAYNDLIAKYETPTLPLFRCGCYLCPECSKKVRPRNNHCHRCGKMLKWPQNIDEIEELR